MFCNTAHAPGPPPHPPPPSVGGRVRPRPPARLPVHGSRGLRCRPQVASAAHADAAAQLVITASSTVVNAPATGDEGAGLLANRQWDSRVLRAAVAAAAAVAVNRTAAADSAGRRQPGEGRLRMRCALAEEIVSWPVSVSTDLELYAICGCCCCLLIL
jgi:hypothetical protein